MPDLVLGPLLRYVGQDEATVWVETDAPCEVEVLDHRARTFHVEGHHYALVLIEGLEPDRSYEYAVTLDGERRWPDAGAGFPASSVRTLGRGQSGDLVFGSCRVSFPHEPPYSLSKDADSRGREVDALYALALRMRRTPPEQWPHLLLLLGDQVYADEVSLGALEFIRSRRDTTKPPGEEVANFEEYTRLYWDAWRDPVLRWLLSTVSSAMIFDDHDVHDDWNTSAAWVEQMRAQPWWDERIIGAFTSYWIYQHIGNLSPRELREDGLFRAVGEAADAGPLLRRFALQADRQAEGSRWSFCRDLGHSKLVVMDSRAGRVVNGGRRSMVDEGEWEWIEREARGDCNHLLLATTLPVLLAPAMHHLEAWNEAVCAGAWGRTAARLGENVRQALDLEHWAAFEESFARLAELLRAVGSGERGRPPASIVMLSGDVHHAYLAEVGFPRGSGIRSAVYQAVCSPFRNPLGDHERRAIQLGWSRLMEAVARALARSAGAPDPGLRWRAVHDEPWFDNQVASLQLDGRRALMRLEKTTPHDDEAAEPRLHRVFERRLA